jgi:DNA-binding NtrC family response regulator
LRQKNRINVNALSGSTKFRYSFGVKILVVDDDELMCLTLKAVFKGDQLFFAKSFDEASSLLKVEYFNAAFLDIQLQKGTKGDGLDLLKLIRERDCYLPCVMISGLDDRETVMNCLELGAVDYVAKGTVSPDAYRVALYKSAVWRKLLSESPAARTPKIGKLSEALTLRGNSTQMNALRENIQRMASLAGPFLILGETGTGKELAARALWAFKKDANRPFVAINCASLPENLVESELFGFEKGSFTGALASKTGLFEAANGGDIFLDEIGELSLDLQAKFLRVLQDKKVRRLGSDKERPLDIRIIAATNVDLMDAVENDEFREDLFYRLNVHQLRMPTLRERPSDVIELFNYFMHENNFQNLSILEDAQKLLESFPWPGNVRQLKAFAEYLRSQLPLNNAKLEANHVQTWMGFNRLRSKNKNDQKGSHGVLGLDPVQDIKLALEQKKSLSIVEMVDSIQKAYVEAALIGTGQNRSQAAKVLGVSRQRLSNWLSDWGIF